MGAGPPLVSYLSSDPRYPAVFDRLVERIYSVLPGVPVDHVGSTAVAGLGGRGVLDIAVVSPLADQDQVLAALRQVGFSDSSFAWTKPMLTSSTEYEDDTFPVLAYILAADHPLRTGLLTTRDRLRRDPAEVQRYTAVKHEALAAGHSTPWAYQQAKNPYLRALASGDTADQLKARPV